MTASKPNSTPVSTRDLPYPPFRRNRISRRFTGGIIIVTIAHNFVDSREASVDYRIIEAKANVRGISQHTGCFRKPGAGEIALGMIRDEHATCFTSPGHAKRLSIDGSRDCIDGKSAGAIRISLG
jgi:hypothetical protein